jgi:hypothetical protein
MRRRGDKTPEAGDGRMPEPSPAQGPRPRAFAAVACLAAALLAGCSAGGDADSPAGAGGPPGIGSLLGVVVDQAIRPLQGVEVTVAPAAGVGAPGNATTGAAGAFALHGLAPGSYVVAAAKPGYSASSMVAHVEADVPEADLPVMKMQLELLASDAPFAVALTWEGIVGCATIGLNLCSVPNQGAGVDPVGDQSAHFFWDELRAYGRPPDAVQVEAVWEPTLATSERMAPYVGWSTPEDWAVFVYGGTFDTTTQASPSFYRVSAEQAAETQLGVANGLIVEFIGAGDYGDPAGEPPGLVVNQPVRLFVHLFYGYVPPDAWRFVADGPPPAPPA